MGCALQLTNGNESFKNREYSFSNGEKFAVVCILPEVES